MLPKNLMGISPPPTGETRIWWVDEPDEALAIIQVLERISQMQQWGDDRETDNLRDHLQAMPGFPGGSPGDHYEIRIRRRAQIVVPRLVL